MDAYILPLSLAASAVMAGVCWLVQLVLYPAFAFVAPDRWLAFHRLHTSRITPIVAPAMLVEMATAVWLVVATPADVSTGSAYVALVLAVVAFASTFALQVPLHNRLSRAYDDATLRRLIATNWLRTLAWTARVAVLLLAAG